MTAPIADDEKPQLAWVPVGQLHINRGYQRDADTRAGGKVIAGICSNFKWALFQPVILTKRSEGGYWVIDGQHRFLAALQLKLPEIPAMVANLPTDAAQAQAFIAINTARVNMNSLAIHHARRLGGGSDVHGRA